MTLTGSDGNPSEWVKIVITMACSIVGNAGATGALMWNLIQDHEARFRLVDLKISTIKEIIDSQGSLRESQYGAIQSKLTEIQVEIGRIQGPRNGR